MKEGHLVVHKKYGIGVIIDVKEIYSSWGHPNTWYRVCFVTPNRYENPRWMSKNNLELLDESG